MQSLSIVQLAPGMEPPRHALMLTGAPFSVEVGVVIAPMETGTAD